ncbi:unnamed protein product [Moneuplotes crassus]|uniref:Uncharacterized protein n=1 Tax=Euplotes crassus TaxID=5936 RepID=A0AAD1XAW3_EUPCR|nr:unnamed protein product [Moneuplotes crassus]
MKEKMLAKMGQRIQVDKAAEEAKQEEIKKKKAEELAKKKKGLRLKKQKQKEAEKLVQAEQKVKSAKEALVFSLILLIEYQGEKILRRHWPIIYNIIDQSQLGEIFEERDANDRCSNLPCYRALSNRGASQGQLLDLFEQEKEKKKGYFNEKATEELLNLFFCSPKCKNQAREDIEKVNRDLDSYHFKGISSFKFLAKYPASNVKLLEYYDAMAEFKALCEKVRNLPTEIETSFKQLVKEESSLDPETQSSSTLVEEEKKQDGSPFIVEKQFTQKEQEDILDKKISHEEVIEGYVPKEQPQKSILKRRNNGSFTLKEPQSKVKFDDDDSTDQEEDTEISEDSSEEDPHEVLADIGTELQVSSYTKLSMLFISACDKNRLSEFVRYPKLEIQNPDFDKLDILCERLRKEFNLLVDSKIEEQTRISLWNEIRRLLSSLNYYYSSIPSLNAKESKMMIYCLVKFIQDHKLVTDVQDWVASLNSGDCEEALCSYFTL